MKAKKAKNATPVCFAVKIVREIECIAEVEIDAHSEEEARSLAEVMVDKMLPSPWREGSVLSQSCRVRRQR